MTHIHCIARRLAPVFEAQGWEWAHTRAGSGVPDAYDIEKVIRCLWDSCSQLYRESAKENGPDGASAGASSGRITVSRSAQLDDAYHVSLEVGSL